MTLQRLEFLRQEKKRLEEQVCKELDNIQNEQQTLAKRFWQENEERLVKEHSHYSEKHSITCKLADDVIWESIEDVKGLGKEYVVECQRCRWTFRVPSPEQADAKFYEKINKEMKKRFAERYNIPRHFLNDEFMHWWGKLEDG